MHIIERRVIRSCIADLLLAGFAISVNDGEETTLRKSTNRTAIFAAMGTTDEDYLFARDAEGRRIGWVRLIYGNEPEVVIADYYTTNLETTLAATNKLVEKLSMEARGKPPLISNWLDDDMPF